MSQSFKCRQKYNISRRKFEIFYSDMRVLLKNSATRGRLKSRTRSRPRRSRPSAFAQPRVPKPAVASNPVPAVDPVDAKSPPVDPQSPLLIRSRPPPRRRSRLEYARSSGSYDRTRARVYIFSRPKACGTLILRQSSWSCTLCWLHALTLG